MTARALTVRAVGLLVRNTWPAVAGLPAMTSPTWPSPSSSLASPQSIRHSVVLVGSLEDRFRVYHAPSLTEVAPAVVIDGGTAAVALATPVYAESPPAL